MASSTTIPIASTKPNKVMVLMVYPITNIKAKVPINETGIAIVGIRVARQFCKNKKTTKITKPTA